MYEQNEVSVFRRLLWLGLWFVAIIAIIWVLVWLAFFHDSSPKVSTPRKTTTQNQSSGSSAKKSTTNDSSATDTSTSSSSTSTNSTTPTAVTGTPSDTLVNTGAGDVLVPFMAASVLGSTLYYLRLRKKILS